MDKLLLSLSSIALLASLTVNSAPVEDSNLLATIDLQQTQPASAENAGDSAEVGAGSVAKQLEQLRRASRFDFDDDNDQRRSSLIRSDALGKTGLRRNKMIGFLPFNGLPLSYAPFAGPFLYPDAFYDDFEAYFGDDDEVLSRASPGKRRRPSNGGFGKNSPIYYIRLPPTPYMFVPGLGYVSQPPSYSPMPPQPLSPFYNLPLDFLANGKPTNIYQWASPAAQFAQPPFVPQLGYPSYQQRPQRPYGLAQRPINPYLQESKVTNLKGPFLFNGRPEDIFLLQNPYNPYSDPRQSSIYSDPRQNAVFSDPRLANAFY